LWIYSNFEVQSWGLCQLGRNIKTFPYLFHFTGGGQQTVWSNVWPGKS
jgi:hypothetical protein